MYTIAHFLVQACNFDATFTPFWTLFGHLGAIFGLFCDPLEPRKLKIEEGVG